MQKLFERQNLAALQLVQKTDHPCKEEHDDNAVPAQQTHARGHMRQSEQSSQESANETDDHRENRANRENAENDPVGDAAFFHLIDKQPPAQPEESAQMERVHGAFPC